MDEISNIKAILRENKQTAHAMRERSKKSLEEAERRDAENVELEKRLSEIEKSSKK